MRGNRFVYAVVAFCVFGWLGCVAAYDDLDDGVPTDEVAADDTKLGDGDGDGEPVAKAARACYVRITCDDGTNRACNGTLGQCAASNTGTGSVTCNGATTSCPTSPPPPPPCGAWCTSQSQCGLEAVCDTYNHRCVCY